MKKIIVISCGPNRETYLEKTLNSLNLDIEILVINDTGRLLNIKPKKNLYILNNKKTIGLTASLCKWSFKYRNYDIIYRLDTGSIPVMERFDIQEKIIQKNPNVGICAARTEFYLEDEENVVMIKKNKKLSSQEIKFKLQYTNPISHSSIAINGEALRDVGGYSTRYIQCQDYYLYLKMIRNKWDIQMTKEILNKHFFIKRLSNTLNKNTISRKMILKIYIHYYGLFGIFLRPLVLLAYVFNLLIIIKNEYSEKSKSNFFRH